MKEQKRRRKKKIAMALLEELVADVIMEAESNGQERGIHARELRNLLDFPREEYYIRFFEAILLRMLENEELHLASPASTGNPARYCSPGNHTSS